MSWFKDFQSLLFINFFFLAIAVLMALLWGYRLKLVLARSNGLRRMAQKFERLFQTTTEGVFRVNANGVLLIVNQAGARILGFENDTDLLKQNLNIREWIPSRAQWAGMARKLKDTGQLNHRILLLKRQDGKTIYVEVVAHLQHEGENRVYEGIFRDVTTRIDLEKELEAHKHHLEELVSERTKALNETNILLSRRETQLKRLARQQTQIQEQTSKRIAHVLHDDAGQLLSAVKIDLDLLEHELKNQNGHIGLAHVEDAQSIIETLMTRVHELALDLRPSILDDMGLQPTLAWFVKRFEDRTGIAVHLHSHGADRRLEGEMETDIYRITQEAMNNTAKHAEATCVEITLDMRDGVKLLISDNGKGFDAERVFDIEKNRDCMGLIGMREKVTSTGGEFALDTAPGRGLTLCIRYASGEAA